MANKELTKASELTGNNIYHIKNQTIYYDVFTKNAYIITNDVVSKFSLYQMRIAAALIVSCLAGLLLQNYIVGFGIGFVAYGVLEILSHLLFFPKLPLNTNFSRPQKEPVTVRYAKMMSRGRIFVIMILSFVSTLMMALNAVLSMSNIFYFITNIMFTLVCLLVFVLSILTFIRKKKDNL